MQIQALGHKLIMIDAQSTYTEKLQKEFELRYQALRDDWNEVWRERQLAINELAVMERNCLDSMNDFNYVGSKDHY